MQPSPSVGGDSNGRGRPPLETWDVVVTVVLLLVDLGLVWIGSLAAAWSGAEKWCQNSPGTCNETLVASLQIGLWGVPLLIFGGCVTLSIFLMKRRRTALAVPLVGAVAIIAWLVLSNHLLLIGLGER